MCDVENLYVLAWQEDYHTIRTFTTDTGLIKTYTWDEATSITTQTIVHDVKDGTELREKVAVGMRDWPVAVPLQMAVRHDLFPLGRYYVEGLGIGLPVPVKW